MGLQEILDRIQNVLYQGVDTESNDLDLLRHDLELHIIDLENNTEYVEENNNDRQRQRHYVRQFCLGAQHILVLPRPGYRVACG